MLLMFAGTPVTRWYHPAGHGEPVHLKDPVMLSPTFSSLEVPGNTQNFALGLSAQQDPPL